MIEELGVITAVDHDHIWVDTQIKTTCGGCHLNNDCGTGALAKAFAPKSEQLVLRCQQAAKVGQMVKLGIPENNLLKASALVYVFPLVVMIVVASLSQWLLPMFDITSELGVIGLTVLSAALSFRTVRHYLLQTQHQGYQPRLLAIMPIEGEKIDLVHVK
jgi:sigma-E factor negative regulatory protein RseC